MVAQSMEIEAELKPTAMAVFKGLGKAMASIAGVIAALSILPAIPFALLAGMETNHSAQMLLAYAPLLFAISAVAAVCCIARITIIRFALAVVPVTFVFVSWLL